MDQLIKLNNQTAGRDRIARLLQYLSRLLWHRLQQRGSTNVQTLKNLEYQLGSFRKVLRFGRSIESIYGALPLLHQEDQTIKFTLIVSKICSSLFLLADHILWLGRADLCTIKTERWGNLCNKYWLYSITMNLVRDFYEITCLLGNNKNMIVPKGGICNLGNLFGAVIKSMTILNGNKEILIDTVKNGCDFFIPLTALGHVKLSPGTVGLLGTISSLAGLIVLLDPKKKMIPS